MQNNNTENNQNLIDKLMDSQSIKQDSNNEDQISISTTRVSSIKYRLYVLIFLMLTVFATLNYILPKLDKIDSLKNTISQKETQVSEFIKQEMQYEKDKDLIWQIELHENTIISCVNHKIWCGEIPEEIRENFGFARAYLQLNNLYDPKMEINEKIILTNINEFLLTKRDSQNENSFKIWKINSIAIWKPNVIVSQLYSIPIRLEASFVNKDYLLAFIENVDKNVLESRSYRILYKIDEINYNIMEYDQEQLVDIKISAFYYQE